VVDDIGGNVNIGRAPSPGLSAVTAVAATLYDSELPYHNFGHAQRSLVAADAILAACAADGVPVDANVVRWAILFHDAGYRADPAVHGCDDRESYAALLARRHLHDLGVDDDASAAVAEAILATRRDAVPGTVEARVVRAADLAEIAADFERFTENTERLRIEHELLTGEHVTAGEWKASAAAVLGHYLEEDNRVSSQHDDGDGVSHFHRVGQANLRRYLSS
jgi:predicted metal-dependent HD superfamily phosphohydrolase